MSVSNKELVKAMSLVTIDLLKTITPGEEKVLTNNLCLYLYCEESVYVINETNNWEEILQILFDDKTVSFESLT